MVETQMASHDDATAESYHAIAESYHRAAVRAYDLGHHQEAQRLAEIALSNRARAHADFLKTRHPGDFAAPTPEIRQASAR